MYTVHCGNVRCHCRYNGLRFCIISGGRGSAVQIVRVAAFAATLIAAPTLGVAADVDLRSGTYYLERCDETQPNGSKDVGFCLGYMLGFSDMNGAVSAFFPAHGKMWCAPEAVTFEQMNLIIVKALREHPERLHEPVLFIAIEAMKRAFPCETGAPK